MEKSLYVRILVLVLLSALLILLILLDEIGNNQIHQKEKVIAGDVYSESEIDSAVVKVLESFGIDKSWINLSEIQIFGSLVKRIERRVSVPTDLLLPEVNLEFKKMAGRYNLSATATENTKENIVTIHLHKNKLIIQTIILKPTKSLIKKVKSYQIK